LVKPETEIVTCSNENGSVTVNADYGVGYGDLYFASSPLWIQNGGNNTPGATDDGHGTNANNHWMTQTASGGLAGATRSYLAGHARQTQICTNDMALPVGGKFDIQAIVPGTTGLHRWASPHIAHDRGTAVDIAGPGSGQCPNNQVNIAAFLQACVANGANVQNSVNEGNHAHCNFASVNTYPH
jgi:hypothetical protein